jgi:prepilin-type N-terminal cleavage/methylation domain-containing protein
MKKRFLQKGFTLVEIMVSLAIFSVVMVVALGAFLKIVDVNKRAQSIESAVNNLNFTMEAMSRELRTGSQYTPGQNSIVFIGKYTTDVVPLPVYYGYRLVVGGKIQRAVPSTTLPLQYIDATAANVNVRTLSFTVTNHSMPIVLIYMAGEVGLVEKAKATFDLQTSVSQRLK